MTEDISEIEDNAVDDPDCESFFGEEDSEEESGIPSPPSDERESSSHHPEKRGYEV